MLFPDEVKPLLLHESRAVRDLAAEYFEDSWSSDPELPLLVAQACRRFGAPEVVHLIVAARRFVLTPESWRLFMELLRETEDAFARLNLAEALVEARWDAELARDDAALSDITVLHPQMQARIERRTDLARWSDSQLWSELQNFADRSKDARYAGDSTMVT